MTRAALALLLGMAGPAFGQEIIVTPLEDDPIFTEPAAPVIEAPVPESAGLASAVEVRVLDRMTGAVADVTIAGGDTAEEGRLAITHLECRFPLSNPAQDAFAHLQIRDITRQEQVFDGWMVASSPALNPLDHSRYDVWVLRCANTS